MSEKLHIDALVNKPVPDLEFNVGSPEEYQVLRQEWTKGERIPKLVNGPDCPVIFEGAGQRIHLMLKGEESAGALQASYVVMEPGAQGASDHHQPREDELWFALQGDWEWTVGEKTARVGPGAFVYAPRNTTHAFANVGKTTAIMFTVNTPAGHERGFEAASKVLSRGGSLQEVEETFAKYDFVFHSPLGS